MTPASDPVAAARRRLIAFALALAVLLVLAFAWQGTPLRAWLDVDRIVGALRALGAAAGPATAVGGLALAMIVAVPLSVATVIAIVAFGPLAGGAYVVCGATLGGAVSYGIGRALGRAAVERLAGPRINGISRRLGAHGLLSVIAIRMVPVAPFAIVNMVAGATQIGLRDFVLGTALGMLPGTIAIALFVEQIVAAIREPGAATLLLVAITVGLIAAGAWALRRWAGGTPGDDAQTR